MREIKGKSFFRIAGWRYAAFLFFLLSLVTRAYSAESPGTPKASGKSQKGNGAPFAPLSSNREIVPFVRPRPSHKAERDESQGESFEEALMEDDKPTAIYKGLLFRDKRSMEIKSIYFTGFTSDRKEPSRKVIDKIVEKAFDERMFDVIVRTSTEETSLAEVLGECKFFLDHFKPSKSREGSGYFTWHVLLPEKRKFFPVHRFHLNEHLAAEVTILKHSQFLSPEFTMLFMTVREKEKYDKMFVTPYEEAEPVEKYRASRFMAQRNLGSSNPLEHSVALSEKHTNSKAYIASTKEDLIVLGVLTGWIDDQQGRKKRAYVQFLGATESNESCTKASLLVEFLTDCRKAEVEQVVLENVPVYDVATVSVALELGFTIERRTEEGFRMVRSGKEPLKDLDAIVYTRKLAREAEVLRSLKYRSIFVPSFLAEAFDAMGANIDVNKELINERAREFFLYAGATVAVLAAAELFRKIRKARRRRAIAKRLRETKLVLDDDGAQHGEQSVQEPAEVAASTPLPADSFLH